MEPTQPYYLGPTPLIVPAPEPAPAWVHNLDMRLDLCDAHHLVPVPSEQFVIVRRLKRASDSGSRWQVAQIVPSIELPPIFDNNVRAPLRRINKLTRVLTCTYSPVHKI